MISKEQAQLAAMKIIADLGRKDSRDYTILEDLVMEHQYAWIFPFSTTRYNETRNVRDMLLGYSPIVVKRSTGEAQMSRSSITDRFLETYITEEDKKIVDSHCLK